MRYLKYLPIIGLVLFLGGCAQSYPLGLSKAEWNSLPKSEQIKLTEEQYKLDQQEEAREAQEQAAEEAEQAREAAAEQNQIQQMHDYPHYGDLVNVTISGGEMKNEHMHYHPVISTSAVVARGETKTVTVQLQESSPRNVYINYAANGSKVIVYLDNPDGEGITLTNNGNWRYGGYYNGETLRLSAYTGIRNVTFSVRYYMPY